MDEVAGNLDEVITKADFGFLPIRLDLRTCNIAIETRPDFDDAITSINEAEGVEGDWVYSPPQRQIGGLKVIELPYPSRVFGLPRTHRISQFGRDKGPWYLDFHVWVLSFFLGIRLTTTEAGFLDATPIKVGTLTDFYLSPRDLRKAVVLADEFWLSHRNKPFRPKQLAGAIHALFLAQYPLALHFEQFIYLYTALDACYALAAELRSPARTPSHSDRIAWMCDEFGMPVPSWAAKGMSRSSTIASIRNPTIHEALFMGEPFGFAVPSFSAEQNVPLEMRCILCRLLVALIGANQ